MKKFIPRLLMLTILLIVCSSGDITFKAMSPALIYIPGHINTIAIIDRSAPDDETVNIIEESLTIEGIGQDKLGTQTTLNGLNDMLKNSVRYNIIRTNVAMVGQNLLSAAFPDPISWTEIEKICQEYQADAIISLEKYDSDFIPTAASLGEGGKGFSARGVASVNIGFRFYDLANKIMVDEYLFTHSMNWDAGGGTILDAVNAMLQKNNAIRQVSYDAGFMYGKRISPSWYYITRHYFRHGKNDQDLEEGARMMEANDWDSAIEALNRALEHGRHRKVKGRAAHNLAVVYEILGDLPRAREYAQMAWGKYKSKKSKDYGFILNERIKEQELLQYQLGQ
jgi:tetratricopeptide (TPR) repeat protein